MKRFLTTVLLFAALVFGATQASAQKYGIIGGANFSSMQSIDKSSATGWQIGGTAQFKLPLGFSIQPSLLYANKASKTGDADIATSRLGVGFIELPVSVQWGPDLLIFRPFVEVTPFIGYAVNNSWKSTVLGKELDPVTNKWASNMNRFEYGLGLGAGVEVWRFQLSCRYNWNFGPLFDVSPDGDVDFDPEILDGMKDMANGKNFGGVTLSLAFLFGK